MMEVYHLVWALAGITVRGNIVRAPDKESAMEIVKHRYKAWKGAKFKYAGTYCPPSENDDPILFSWVAPSDWVDFE